MTEPIDELQRAMDSATPVPDAVRRASNLAQAREIFGRTQGSTARLRPTHDRPNTWAGLRHGVGAMLATLVSRPALTGAATLAGLGFIALIPVLWEQLAPEPWTPLPPPSAVTSELQTDEEVLAAAPPEATLPGSETSPVPPADAVEVAGTEIREGQVELLAMAVPDEPGSAKLTPELESYAPPAAMTRGVAEPAHSQTEIELRALRSLALTRDRPEPDGPGLPSAVVSLDRSDAENFANEDPNPLKIAAEEPVSTFSIDVDTASYAVIRSSLMDGFLPPADAVRIEEMINYFPYAYLAPRAGEAPFRPTVTLAPTPWNPDTQLMQIGLQGRLPAIEARPPLNLVFLIDTSGSMDEPNKLPLLVQSLRLLLGQLRPDDDVAIAVYAGSAGQVLGPTPASDRRSILHALDRLASGGSTAGAEGLRLAYQIAAEMAADGEVTRVILATDGDFNVGIADPEALKDFIARKRKSGTYLSVLGFGRGNLDDTTMQALAQNGNGQAAYIDTLIEARKVLVDQLTGALFPIANDVKIQVEFNPATVAEYRLIGYETRALRREDFNNDKIDAGEMGAGHSVTAIYEITPVGSPAVRNDPLRYAPGTDSPEGAASEFAHLRLRYKEPGENISQLIELPITPGMGAADADTSFATAIAGFGQLLRGSVYLGDWSYADAAALAQANTGIDRFGYRHEAVQLMRLAESLAD